MEKATYERSHKTVSDLFSFHKLNEQGMQKAIDIANIFDDTLTALNLPQGRYRSLVETKLEEASFFAKKAMATDPINQG